MSSLNISVTVSADCEYAALNVNGAVYALYPDTLRSKQDVRDLLVEETKFLQDACLGLLEDMTNTMKTRLRIQCDVTRNVFATDVKFVINNQTYLNDVDCIRDNLDHLPMYIQAAAMSLLQESI
jgi:hypothetical protein